MGIKMGAAVDSAGAEWHAKDYLKGKGQEPLQCVHCPVQVTHQSAHTRERDDKPILVPAYFRLLPGGQHADHCKYAVADAVRLIASESDALIESVRDGRYRLRLVMVRDALNGQGKKPARAGASEPHSPGGKTYLRSASTLPAYVNSARRVLKLRALCDTDDEIAKLLELVFEGNTIVPWSQFYIETERYLEAYNRLSTNTVQHPVALHGTVKSVQLSSSWARGRPMCSIWPGQSTWPMRMIPTPASASKRASGATRPTGSVTCTKAMKSSCSACGKPGRANRNPRASRGNIASSGSPRTS
ncbi:hypothetical protein LP420_15075 [Massilia sp. B-10]|nr:hypothetical protein LP420_15075 [Massilia sp. B-10]